MELLNTQLSQEAKEIAELEALLDKKKFAFHNNSQEYFLKNLNKSPEHKLELIKENIRSMYFPKSSSFDSFIYKSPITWESAIPSENGWSRSDGFCNYYELVEALKQFLKNKNVKTTYNPRFNYNKETGEVMGFTSKDWFQEKKKEDMSLFSGFLNACAYQHGDDKTKNRIKNEKIEEEKIKKETHNPIIQLEVMYDKIMFQNQHNITSDMILKQLKQRGERYEKIIIYSVYLKLQSGSSNNGIALYIRFSGINKKSH